MKIWNTKHALSQGVIEQDAEYVAEFVSDKYAVVKWPNGVTEYLYKEGKDWHRTRESALARADVMRKERIASLRNQIVRLEALNFEQQQRGKDDESNQSIRGI
jgi:hypothetical protein